MQLYERITHQKAGKIQNNIYKKNWIKISILYLSELTINYKFKVLFMQVNGKLKESLTHNDSNKWIVAPSVLLTMN